MVGQESNLTGFIILQCVYDTKFFELSLLDPQNVHLIAESYNFSHQASLQ